MYKKSIWIVLFVCFGSGYFIYSAQIMNESKFKIEYLPEMEEEQATPLELQMIRDAAYGDPKKVLEALHSGARINAQDKDGFTALMNAANVGRDRLSVIKELIKKHANLNIKNKWGNTALMASAAHGELEVNKTLIKAGAKLDIKNNNGQTALMEAITSGGYSYRKEGIRK